MQNGFAKIAGTGAAVALAGYLVGQSKAAEAAKPAAEVRSLRRKHEEMCLQARVKLLMNPGHNKYVEIIKWSGRVCRTGLVSCMACTLEVMTILHYYEVSIKRYVLPADSYLHDNKGSSCQVEDANVPRQCMMI